MKLGKKVLDNFVPIAACWWTMLLAGFWLGGDWSLRLGAIWAIGCYLGVIVFTALEVEYGDGKKMNLNKSSTKVK